MSEAKYEVSQVQKTLGTDHLTCKGGGYGFLFRSEKFFRTTLELEFFFLSAKREIFFLEFNIRLYDKNSESDYFFFLHQNQNIFFSNIGNQNIFLEKNITPLQVKWSFPYMSKTLNQIFFFLHQNLNIFFSNIRNQNICLEKNHNPPSS
jgi:hypothetical protein